METCSGNASQNWKGERIKRNHNKADFSCKLMITFS